MKMHKFIVISLILVMFSRVLQVFFGLPAVINLVHFPIVLVIFILTIDKTGKKRNPLIFGLVLLFLAILISALINGAGMINVFLEFLLFAEPFLFLTIIVNVDYSKEAVSKLGNWLVFFGVVQIPFALLFYFPFSFDLIKGPLALDKLNLFGAGGDAVRGTMISMVNGSHVLGAISIVCAVYMLYYYRMKPLWLKFSVIFLLLTLPFLSDAKQAIFIFLISYGILMITKIKNPKRALKYALIAFVLIIIILKLLSIMSSSTLSNANLGIEAKLQIFPLLDSYHDSSYEWLFGEGPGHTVSRLAYMLPNYWSMLEPLGATKTEIADETRKITDTYPIIWY